MNTPGTRCHEPGAIARGLYALALSTLAHLMPAPSVAAQAERVFCITSTCYPTLEAAEAALRVEPNPPTGRAYLEKRSENYSQFPRRILHFYSVKDRPNTVLEDWYSTGVGPGCAGVTPQSPVGPSYCDTLPQLEQITESYFTSQGYCNVDYTPHPLEVLPWIGNATPMSSYNGIPASRLMLVVTMNWPSSNATMTYRYPGCSGTFVSLSPFNLGKVVARVCPPLFRAKSSAHSSQYPFVCANDQSGLIEERLAQFESCEIGNPCVPATGQKVRHEVDIAEDGLRLERHYRSLAQLPSSAGLGGGWTHNFDTSVRSGSTPVTLQDGSSSVFVIDERGDLEQYRLADTAAGVFRSVNRAGRLLRRRSDPARWELQHDEQRTLHYDASGGALDGKLIGITHRRHPTWNLSLHYDRHARLEQVRNAAGRSFTFAYDGWTLERVTAADGAEYAYVVGESGLQSVTYPDGSVRTFLYEDPAFPQHLTGIHDENGKRHAEFAYDDTGRVILSRLLTGNPEAPHAETQTLLYDEGATRLTNARGETRVFRFDGGTFERLIGVSDSEGESARVYGADGRILRVTSRAGIATGIEYDARHEIVRVEAQGSDTDPDSPYSDEIKTALVWDETVDAPRERRIYRCAAPSAQAQPCNESGNPRWELEALGRKVYNARGQITARCDYDPADSSGLGYVCGSSTNAPAGVRQTTVRHCESTDVASGACPIVGQTLAIDGPRTDLDDRTTFVYRMHDDPACATTPEHCAWRRGDEWKRINALGHVTETTRRDGAGRPLSVIDSSGLVTDFRYHPRGWLEARILRGADDHSETDDRTTRMDYLASGQLRQITFADGSHLRYDHDDAGRVIAVHDTVGNSIRYALDAAGERISEETLDSAGVLRRRMAATYDTLGRAISSADAEGHLTLYTHDSEGRLDTRTDALGHVTDYDYDPMGRLRRVVADAHGVAADTRNQHDARGNVTRTIDPKGLATDYTLNAFDERVRVVSPDSGTTTHQYDSAGNRVRSTDARGVTIDIVHDAINRPVERRVAGATQALVRYEYDAASSDCAADETHLVGRVARMIDESGSTSYCHNRFGDLTRKVQRTGNRTLVLTWDYLPDGRVRRMSYPDGSVLEFQHDDVGRLSAITRRSEGQEQVTLVSGASYYPFGPLASFTFGNGLAVERTHDANYRPVRIRDLDEFSASLGLDLSYRYDAAGRVDRIQSGVPGTLQRHYRHDGLDRLTEMLDADHTTLLRQYTYDATGNRLSAGALRRVDTSVGGEVPGEPDTSSSWQWQSEVYDYAADSHRLLAVGHEPRGYDASGNLVSIGAAQNPGGFSEIFGYDASGRLRDVDAMQSYAYNGRGERVSRRLPDYPVHSIHDQQGRWLGDYDRFGVALQQVVWLDQVPVALIVNTSGAEKLFYVQADALGTPRTLIDPARDAQGVVAWRWPIENDPFGADLPEADVDGDGVNVDFDMRFPGQRFDTSTGLHYNYFRDYAPATGRYMQSDPLGLAAGSSTYAYVENGPLDGWDPLGLVRWEGKVIAAGASHLGYVGGYTFDLTSQCVKGRKARALLQAWAVGMGADAFPIVPVGAVVENVVLEDHRQDIYPQVLQGLFATVGIGATVGPVGGSCRFYELGANHLASTTVPIQHTCHSGGRGFEVGASLAVGHAKLKSVSFSQCDECEPIEAVRW